MPFWRFTALSLLGSLPWVLALAFAGYEVGGEWTHVREGFQYVDYAVLALVVLGIVYAAARRRARSARRAEDAEPAAAE